MELVYLKKKTFVWFICGIVLVLLAVSIMYFAGRAPKNFPDPAIFSVSDGMSVVDAAKALKKAHIIRSTFLFTNYVIYLKHERKLVNGEYYFEKPMSVFGIARRITSGNYNTNQLKTTIPEGSTLFDISLIIQRRYQTFDSVHFITLAKDREGYLFPDTYYFGAEAKPEKVVNIMTATFNTKIHQPDIANAITAFGKPESDIIKMASILEGEARQTKTRQIIAGILWKRLELGIPLQVDAAFRYINGKTTSELTLDDLKIDSPYNTYIYKGLPPTPISNPGLDSIMAAVTPVKTDYLYFLTDKNGNMHYARTLDEHAANKAKYLK